jgi:hypothetical protein
LAWGQRSVRIGTSKQLTPSLVAIVNKQEGFDMRLNRINNKKPLEVGTTSYSLFACLGTTYRFMSLSLSLSAFLSYVRRVSAINPKMFTCYLIPSSPSYVPPACSLCTVVAYATASTVVPLSMSRCQFLFLFLPLPLKFSLFLGAHRRAASY